MKFEVIKFFSWLIFTNLIIGPTHISVVTGAARFTKFPPTVLFVSNGGTARFVWDYHVDNKATYFKTASPVWFYETLQSAIGADLSSDGWKWNISSLTCPQRYLNPTRVSRESKATLVIKNVIAADNGTYGCSLILKNGTRITSTSTLFITVPPRFISGEPPSTKSINENQDLRISCSADGYPAPNITWFQLGQSSKVELQQGVGSALLTISQILRNQSGKYECEAINNKDEKPVSTETTVTVNYPPKINEEKTTDQLGCINHPVTLFCETDGSPEPKITWTNQNGKELAKEPDGLNLSLTFTMGNTSEFGNYTCTVVNKLGSDSHVISIKKSEGTCPPLVFTGTPTPGSTSGVPAGVIAGVVIAGILAIAGLIIALVFCYRRKSLEDSDPTPRLYSREQRVQMSSLPDQEQYASLQRNTKPTTTTDARLPQYAVVDKTKKKKNPEPGEIFYADLAHDFEKNEEPRPPSNRHPSNETSTVYADIAGSRQMQPAPQYGNLNRDVKDLYI